MFGKWKKEDGAITIEASVVFFTVLLIVLMLINITHILYEQVRINALAQSAAERGAAIYAVAGKDMYTGRIGRIITRMKMYIGDFLIQESNPD